MPDKKVATPARGLSPSALDRGATCQLRPPTPSQNHVCCATQARRRSLSLGGSAAFELASLARGAAMAVIGSCLVERCRTGERPLSLGARSWCDVLAAASNFKTAPRGSCGAGASVLAVFREETQYSSFLHVRAVPRWLWSVLTLPRGAAPANVSPLRRTTVVRRVSCGLQRQAGYRVRSKRTRAGSSSL